MVDLNIQLRKMGNRKIVNQDVITLPDRNIDNIIINCYANLYGTKLAAYSMVHSDVTTEFHCEFKAQIDKLKGRMSEKLKNVDLNTTENISRILKINGTPESINLKELHNDFKILKLKYIIDPVEGSSPKQTLFSINETIQNWKYNTDGYQHVSKDTYEYLLKLKKEYTKLSKEDTSSERSVNPNDYTDLFVKEQMILIPIYNNDSKYVIDGIKYYGVFNNCDTAKLTKEGAYGVKLFKNGKYNTHYLRCIDDVVTMNFFEGKHNIFHLLTKESALTTPKEDVFPPTDNPRLQQIWDATYEHARLLEMGDHEALSKYRLGNAISMPDTSKKQHGRAGIGDNTYVQQILSAVEEYIDKLDHKEEQEDKTFEFLGTLEDEIFKELNTNKINNSSKELSVIKNRVNLSPTTILKIIKKGSGETASNILFTSTSSEPNPFDIFYLFAFMRTTQHTVTTQNKNKVVKERDKDKWIKYDDTKYFGEFSPKSENNIGRSTTLKLSIPSKYLVKRKVLGDI